MDYSIGDKIIITVDYPDGNEGIWAGDTAEIIEITGGMAPSHYVICARFTDNDDVYYWYLRENEFSVVREYDNEDVVPPEIGVLNSVIGGIA